VQEVCAAKVGVGRKRKERKIPKTKNVGSANFIAHKYRRNINPFKIFLWSEKSVRINKPMTKIDKETRLALIALGGAIIIFGAFFLNDFLLLFQKATDRVLTNGAEDLTTLVWKKSATTTPWQTRDSHTVFEFKNKLWLLGGIDGTTNTNGTAVHYWEMPHFNDIWSSADGMSWTKESAVAAWPPRRSASVGELNSSLFLFGGWSPVEGYANNIYTSLDAVNWKLSKAHTEWPAREGQVVLTFQNKLWMFGGVNYDKREVKNDVWYSSDGLTWKEATTTIPWAKRWDHTVVEFKNELYLIGGMNLSGVTFGDVWKSTDGLNWQKVTDTPPWESRQGLTAVVYKDALWILGRLNDAEHGGVNDVWFTKNGTDWQKTKIDPPWLGREDHSAIVFQNKMWILGGMDKDWHWQNDVWYSELP
jgi:hypothetical protein